MSAPGVITLPELSLVVLIGTSGSGKSTFARQHFKPTEILSSDYFRGLVADDENDQAATKDAFDALHHVLALRLKNARLTVVDATNVRPEDRKPLVELARRYHVLPVAVVLQTPERVAIQRNESRPDRQFGPHVVLRQAESLRKGLRGLEREGFRYVHLLRPEEAAAVTIERQPLWNNRKYEHGPFDIIGDVHGCADELRELLTALGYREELIAEPDPFWGATTWRHPEGRKAVFLGDLVDRGPLVIQCVRIARNMVVSGTALAVPGNHDIKLVRALRGKQVKIAHGLAESLAEFEALPEEMRGSARQCVADFLDSLVSHFVLAGGKLVVAHAGLKEELQGRGSGAVREFCLYGETTGETDEFGLPVRYNWASEYRGRAMVVYGHTPVPEPEWLNGTINIDTGCVFGGKLSALRYPERELVQVPAARVYAEPVRPFLPAEPPKLAAQQEHDTLLDIADVTGKRIIETGLHGRVTVSGEQATAALEVISRFAVDPRWLIYLPPTMSPSETSARPDVLEHPDEAFAFFERHQVQQVVCEEKHMGSRAVVVVCREPAVATRRFGIEPACLGTVYTRTGRPFFTDAALEQALLARVRDAMTAAGLWEEWATDWVCLDCELMPWSAKVQELIRNQYAAVGAAGESVLGAALAAVQQAAESGVGTGELAGHLTARLERVQRYRAAYRRYCWPVAGLDGLKLAPFHVLAAEGHLYTSRTHVWHMEQLHRLCAADPRLLLATPYRLVNLNDGEQRAAAAAWWEELTGCGGEGMVVKPLEFVTRGARGLVQPAVKVRGREYLRIIYGPEYTAPDQLARLRSRGLAGKRSLALREFALGLEALQRFLNREPLRRVHECVFGVLALESEPVDPRL